MFKLFQSKSEKEQCTITYHRKEEDMFCKDCKVLICRKCIKSNHHKHSITDIDDLFDEIINDNSSTFNQLLKSIKDKELEKIQQEELFNSDIKSKFDKQSEYLSKYFRDLHDNLHIKEVELKRELQSYHDDNIETLASKISTLEDEIRKSHEFQGQLNAIKDSAQPNKAEFVQQYSKIASDLLKVKTKPSASQYQTYHCNPLTFENCLKSTNNLNLLKFNLNIKSTPIKDHLKAGIAVALYDFIAADDTELTFREGDLLNIINKDAGGWWECEDGNGKIGWTPANYLKVIE